MPLNIKNRYELIETSLDLGNFVAKHSQADYLCFDTEFVGEKRYQTRLCLIQLATPHGNYLIDPFKVKDLGPFLGLIQDEHILKITHAGENDYRLLFKLFNILPKHVFDTQIAAAFLGHRYPVSFKKLAKQELNWDLDKGYTVADWESRPFNEKQLEYALHDVIPLYEIYQSQLEKLKQKQMVTWAEIEFKELEKEEKYHTDPHREAIKHNMMPGLKKSDQLFLLRLLKWRRSLAKERNQSREMILGNKYIGHIVKSIDSGKQALLQNRRISNKIIDRYWHVFSDLYNQKITDEESQVLKRIPQSNYEDPYEELLLEFMYLLIKRKALEAEIAIDMAFSRSWLKQVKQKEQEIIGKIKNSWRSEFLGHEMVELIEKYPDIEMNVQGSRVELT